MKHLISLFLSAAMLLGLCACTIRLPEPAPEPSPTPTPKPQPVCLWYVGGTAPLDALMAELSAQFSPENLQVRAFESELMLARELDDQVPDMIVCDYYHAADLDADGHLTDLGDECSSLCPPLLAEASPIIGRTFFPLSADAWVLYANSALYETNAGTPLAPESLSTIGRFCNTASEYTAHTDLPFYTADSFAPFFAACLAQNGIYFSGVREADMQNKAYTSLYNLLAETAYSNALQIDYETDSRSLVESGQVVCAFQSASSLAPLAEGCTVLPLPMQTTGTPAVRSRLIGLAVTCLPSNTQRCAAVLHTLYAGMPQASAPFLQAGQIPFVGTEAPDSGDALETVLWQLRSSRFSIFDPNSDYLTNFSLFDSLFRSAMQQLNRS